MRGPARAYQKTAYHRAGHAVARRFLGLSVKRVTIRKAEELTGVDLCSGTETPTRRHYPESPSFHDRHQWRMERDVMVCLAGNEAEQMFSGRNDFFAARKDYARAAELLACFTPELDRRIGDGVVIWSQTKEFKTHLQLLRLKIRRLLSANWPAVEGLATRLMEKGTLSGPDAVTAMGSGPSTKRR